MPPDVRRDAGKEKVHTTHRPECHTVYLCFDLRWGLMRELRVLYYVHHPRTVRLLVLVGERSFTRSNFVAHGHSPSVGAYIRRQKKTSDHVRSLFVPCVALQDMEDPNIVLEMLATGICQVTRVCLLGTVKCAPVKCACPRLHGFMFLQAEEEPLFIFQNISRPRLIFFQQATPRHIVAV